MTEETRTVEEESAEASAKETDAGKKVVRLSVGQEMSGTIKQVTDLSTVSLRPPLQAPWCP